MLGVTTEKVIRQLTKNSFHFWVEILDTPLRKRDRGGCSLKRMFVMGLTGVFGRRAHSGLRQHWWEWGLQMSRVSRDKTRQDNCLFQCRQLRSSGSSNYTVPRTRTKLGDRAFSVAGSVIWNSIPESIRSVDNVHTFKRLLKTHFF